MEPIKVHFTELTPLSPCPLGRGKWVLFWGVGGGARLRAYAQSVHFSTVNELNYSITVAKAVSTLQHLGSSLWPVVSRG